MKLSGIINDLDKLPEHGEQFSVLALVHEPRTDANDDTLGCRELPIVDILVDQDESSINLIVETFAAESPERYPVSLPIFSSRLRNLLPAHEDYELYIGAVSYAGGYEVRIDYPIIGVATNTNEKKFAVLHWFERHEQA